MAVATRWTPKELTKKGQLILTFEVLLTNMVDELNSNCSHLGSKEEISTIKRYSKLLVKEVD